MNTEREWRKLSELEYELWVNQEKIGSIQFTNNSLASEAYFEVGTHRFTIKRTGFWKNALEISSGVGMAVANIRQEKWYANTMVMDYKNTTYKLSVRNNPLAEWVLEHNNELVLSYGLSTKDKNVGVEISKAKNNHDYLFDFVLWYLFLPIAIENISQDLVFTLLVA